MGSSKHSIINISHNYNERKYFKKSLEKYFVFSNTIEYLIFQERISNLADCSLESLQEMIKKCSNGKIKDEEWIKRWIAELSFMGLIECVESEPVQFRLTEAGKESYRQQTFQSIYSTLLNAKDSRCLSIIAIIIAVLAVILSIIFR